VAIAWPGRGEVEVDSVTDRGGDQRARDRFCARPGTPGRACDDQWDGETGRAAAGLSGWWSIAGQTSGFTAADPPHLQGPLAYGGDAPAVDVVDGTGRELGREPVAGGSHEPSDLAPVAHEHHHY
jgi:hypothetical protein